MYLPVSAYATVLSRGVDMGDGKSDLLLAVEGLPTIGACMVIPHQKLCVLIEIRVLPSGRVIAHIMTWISHAWQSFGACAKLRCMFGGRAYDHAEHLKRPCSATFFRIQGNGVYSSHVRAMTVVRSLPGCLVAHGLMALLTVVTVHRHPQIVCFTSLCLFLGPMVLLIPFILFHEMAILFLFNLGFITHGLTPGSYRPPLVVSQVSTMLTTFE